MDIGGAVSRGIARSQRVMFRPFSIGAWFAFGFVFLLAGLVDPIADWNGKLELPDFHPGRGSPSAGTLPDIPELPPEVATALDQHATAIAAAAVASVLVGLAISVALTWVGCRGLMMAYRSASAGWVGISEGWRETAKPANALFRFHLLVGAASFVIALPLLALAGSSIVSAWRGGERSVDVLVRMGVPYLVVVGLVGLAVMALLFVARQFIAPFLLFFGGTVREAWARFFRVLGADAPGVALFVLARFLLALVLGVLSSFLSTLTCCIGGLPLLHQTLLAPILFFDRAFTLHALASLGPEYAAMAPELPPNPWRR